MRPVVVLAGGIGAVEYIGPIDRQAEVLPPLVTQAQAHAACALLRHDAGTGLVVAHLTGIGKCQQAQAFGQLWRQQFDAAERALVAGALALFQAAHAAGAAESELLAGNQRIA